MTVDGPRLRLWDPGSRELMATLRGHRWLVNLAIVSPDGRTIASIGRDIATGECEVKLWESGG